jgi:hypothetical protein
MSNRFLDAKEASLYTYRTLGKLIGTSSVAAVHLVHDPGRAKDPEKLLKLASFLHMSEDEATEEWKFLRAKHLRQLAERKIRKEDL